MRFEEFIRENHIFSNEAFLEIIKDAVRFLHGTPVQPVPPSKKFEGSGIYVLYYTGQFEPYRRLSELNRLAYQIPIYVGKAVPPGWRQGRTHRAGKSNFSLHSRLRQHSKNLADAVNLSSEDFASRFMIFEGGTASMISTVESFLVAELNPLWNSTVDGFGNHDPGKGRYEQEMSSWDLLHPGREFAKKLQSTSVTVEELTNRISRHLGDG